MCLKINVFAVLVLFVLTMPLHAQEACTTFFKFKEGTSLEYTSYNKKGKVEAKTNSKVASVSEVDGGYKATMESTMYDKKGKELSSGTYEVYCEGNVLKMDVSGMLNPAMQEAFTGMEVEITGNALEIPNQLEVGMSLPDASTTIKAGTNGLSLLSMTVNIVDREVERMETITTPVDTYECYKINQTSEVKMMVSRQFNSVDYFAEGIGVVRSEMYDKRGNLESYMVLTAYSAPD